MAGKFGFVFVALVLFALAFADVSITSYQVLPATIRPGVNGRVVIILANTGPQDVTGVQLEAIGTNLVQSNMRASLGDFRSGVSTTATVPFTVADNAPSAIYNLPIRFTYYTSDGVGFKDLNVPITVVNPPSFQISSQRETVFTNGDFTVNGTLGNTGGKAFDVKLSLDSTSFLPNGPSPLLIGDISASRDFTLPLTLSGDVTSGKYSVPVLLSYRDELGQDQATNLTLTVSVNRRGPDFVASVSSDKLTPGSSSKVSVNVKNVGTDAAYNVKVSLYNGTVFTPLGVTELNIGSLAPGEEGSAQFDFGVNQASPGFYSIPFKVRYENVRGEEQAYRIVNSGVNVQSSNEISVYVSGKTSPIVSGQTNTFSVLVSNIGSSAIKSLSVRISGDAFEVLDAQDSQYIGGLQEDDFSSVQYKVLVKNVPEATYNLTVESTFKDAYNIEHTSVNMVPVRIVSAGTAAKFGDAAANGSNGNGLIILGVIGLVVLIVAYFAYKRFFGAKKKE